MFDVQFLAENTSTKASLEFVACLDRKLDMNRAFISPKVPEGSVTAESSRSNTDTSQQGNIYFIYVFVWQL